MHPTVHRVRPVRVLVVAALAAAITMLTLLPASAKPKSSSSGYTLFGDAALVSPGNGSPTAAQIRSDATIAPGYGGVDFNIPAGLTVADLNTLSTDYMFTAGSCGGGAPRFQINVSSNQSIFVYIGPPPSYTGCPPNVWSNTGNLAAPTNLVDASQLGGSFYEPYAAVQAAYGTDPVLGIQVVVDASWFAGTQTVRVDNVQINNSTTTFESGDSCKKGGWQQFTSSPGPFKNQGDCVSYFATGGKNG
jgi:hypothetical protein